jgi:hypothetical protein
LFQQGQGLEGVVRQKLLGDSDGAMEGVPIPVCDSNGNAVRLDRLVCFVVTETDTVGSSYTAAVRTMERWLYLAIPLDLAPRYMVVSGDERRPRN